MKKILLLVAVCCALMAAQAQRVYFFYLQSDNKTPFYLKTGDKVYSSTAGGYLIVPRLVDSTYNVVIGKPGVPEVRFTIPVNQKDHGFLLREVGQKLSLFDLQNMAVIEPVPTGEGSVSYQQKGDRFTRLLSQAADDTTLLYVAVVQKAEKPTKPAAAVKTETTSAPTQKQTETPANIDTLSTVVVPGTAVAGPDTVAAVAQAVQEPPKQAVNENKEVVKKETETTAKADPVKEAPVQPEPKELVAEEKEFKRSIVTRRAESSTSEGFGLVFTDSADGVVDTIRLVIPNPKVAFQTTDEEEAKEVKEDSGFLQLNKTAQASQPVKEPETPKRKGLFGNRKAAATEEQEKTEEKQKEKEDNTVAVTKDAGCRDAASSNEVSRLRRNMVGKSSEEDMIAEAQKYFKSKCFTTLQIKSLSSLLLTSNGRYRFFEVAYNRVSDKENFKNLQNELWDREDINRFKALLAL